MEWDFGDVLLAMAAFFFWFILIWMFISVFADIFRRHDLSGWAKAGWAVLIVVLPLIGILVYLIARPAVLAEDRQRLEQQELRRARQAGYSPAEEIQRLAALRDEGRITPEEYERLKQQVMA